MYLSSGGLLATAAQADICGFNLVLKARGLIILETSRLQFTVVQLERLQFNAMQLREPSYPRGQQAAVYRRAARKGRRALPYQQPTV
jgi:hypothetical protein